MSIAINLNGSSLINLSVINENQASRFQELKNKKWSFVNIYHLKELRDIYLALNAANFNGDIKLFAGFCEKYVSFEKEPWTYRKVEEYINALRNFGIVGRDKVLDKQFFKEKSWNDVLDIDDLSSLRLIFYQYFRFKEIHSWFVSIANQNTSEFIEQINELQLITNSKPLYSFSYNSRFTDAFISELKNGTDIYYLDNEIAINRAVMRLWDVYIKWGRTLGVIERFNLDQLGISLSSKGAINCNYHINNSSPKLSLYEYMNKYTLKKKVFVPELIYKIAIDERLSINAICQFILNEYSCNKHLFSIDNTSEIFIKVKKIKPTDSILFPIYRNSYISHLTLMQ